MYAFAVAEAESENRLDKGVAAAQDTATTAHANLTRTLRLAEADAPRKERVAQSDAERNHRVAIVTAQEDFDLARAKADAAFNKADAAAWETYTRTMADAWAALRIAGFTPEAWDAYNDAEEAALVVRYGAMRTANLTRVTAVADARIAMVTDS